MLHEISVRVKVKGTDSSGNNSFCLSTFSPLFYFTEGMPRINNWNSSVHFEHVLTLKIEMIH